MQMLLLAMFWSLKYPLWSAVQLTRLVVCIGEKATQTMCPFKTLFLQRSLPNQRQRCKDNFRLISQCQCSVSRNNCNSSSEDTSHFPDTHHSMFTAHYYWDRYTMYLIGTVSKITGKSGQCILYRPHCTLSIAQCWKVQSAHLDLSSGACVPLQGKKSVRWTCDALKCPRSLLYHIGWSRQLQ